jgi:putative N6-adenine-specific DNA methylase
VLKFSAPCIFGLEGLCANEFKFLGLKNVEAHNGKVTFEGDFSDMAKANINSRYAERIQILLAEFEAVSFEELFEGIKSVAWEDFIGVNDAFPVKGRCLSSKLMSVPDCQKIIKKAVVTRLSEKYMLPWLEESGPLHQIQFLIMNDKVSVMLDTSGAGLHKRGYRAESNEAPIKETLAAAMADLSRVRGNHFVVDPMCGSGTILIEAALKAMKIAPGINRYFAAEKWNCVPSDVWKEQREIAKANEKRDCDFRAEGYDIDELALEVAKKNAKLAGVADRITFAKRDIKDFELNEGFMTVITNPPYGERLLDVKSAEELYKVMGEKFKRTQGKSYTIITPDDDFEKIFGRKADKRRKLYNGTLKCQLYMYFK